MLMSQRFSVAWEELLRVWFANISFTRAWLNRLKTGSHRMSVLTYLCFPVDPENNPRVFSERQWTLGFENIESVPLKNTRSIL